MRRLAVPFACSVSRWSIAAILLVAGALDAAEPVIAEKDLVPGGQIRVELAALGESRISVDEKRVKPAMCEMKATLPENWERGRQHPVLCVYRGWNGGGGAYDDWKHVVGGRNFIVLTVDFQSGGGDSGFTNMLHALKVLERAVPIDRQSLVVAADGGGSWTVASQFPIDRAFAAAVTLGGPIERIDDRTACSRPFLVVANRDDTGGTNVDQKLTFHDRQLLFFEALRRGGAPAQLLVVDKLWHWREELAPRLREFLHRSVSGAEMKRAYWLDREFAATADPGRRRWLAQQLAESWVEMPSSAKARKALNAPDAPDAAAK